VTDLTIGIVGGGQLARMMNEAATPARAGRAPAGRGRGHLGRPGRARHHVGDYTDAATLTAFAAGVDAVTFDHEHVPTDLLRGLQDAGVAVRPGPDALVYAQDKAAMRERLTEPRHPGPGLAGHAHAEEFVAFGDEIGWPLIAKTSRGGYDGKGVWKVDGPDGAAEPFAALGRTRSAPPSGSRDDGEARPGRRCRHRGRGVRPVHPRAVGARRAPPGGESVVYPVSETVQRDGICHETTTPAPGLDPDLRRRDPGLRHRIADELGVVGVLAVELMERPDGEVVVNELAMRPHNTGHWTIEGAVTSQFENHLRAVADLPLGSTALRAPVVVMSNVLGGVQPRPRRLAAGRPGRPGRPRPPLRQVGQARPQGRARHRVRHRRRRHAGRRARGVRPPGRSPT
jgi:5-(carboxyamino)imidazole ribonucleotide synthase